MPGTASGTIGLKQELGEGVAPAPITDAVSALVNLGYSRDHRRPTRWRRR